MAFKRVDAQTYLTSPLLLSWLALSLLLFLALQSRAKKIVFTVLLRVLNLDL